ncbi:MAG: hypothetical protein COW85_12140 [Ignavibacteria bacterium CG22_combo_CG10-13_8_21_14_all_37_15]|nr:MAG: hypothetical protein COW85_12140 [Ignavibacteria bacterium CG22_combo_CG10-13_8_21_14_all_37_15]
MKKIFFLLLFLEITIISCKDDPVTKPPQPIPIDSTSHKFVWEVDTLGIWQSTATSVWFEDKNNIWVAGFFTLSDSTGSNISHWDGKSWNFYGTWDLDLLDIFGFSNSNIWAVGFWHSGARIVHWDGTKWTEDKLTNIKRLNAVWGAKPNSIYAVGVDGTIAHYNGTSWTSMTSGTQIHLTNIWGTSDKDIYAVGGDDSNGFGVLLRYDGIKWNKIYERFNQPGIPSGYTETIWGSDGKYYLTCSGGEFSGGDTSWITIYSPVEHTRMESIHGSSIDNFFIVGHFGSIIHWNGKSWYKYPEFYRKSEGDLLKAVWYSNNNVVVVGTSEDGRGIVYRGKRIN